MKYYLLAVLLLHSTFLETYGYEWMAELQDLIKFFYTEELIYGDLQTQTSFLTVSGSFESTLTRVESWKRHIIL